MDMLDEGENLFPAFSYQQFLQIAPKRGNTSSAHRNETYGVYRKVSDCSGRWFLVGPRRLPLPNGDQWRASNKINDHYGQDGVVGSLTWCAAKRIRI